MALVSELLTKVKADTSDFTKKMGDASKSAEGFSAKFTKMGAIGAAVVGVALVGAFTALIHVVNSTTQEIDELVNTSMKLGTSVDAVQKLQYAAKLADVDTGALNGSMRILVRTLNNLDAGNKNTAEAFKKLGLSAKDLQGLSLDQAFIKISEEIAKLPTALDQAKVGTQIFGRGFQEVSNLVRSDIAAAGKDFERFGGILTEEGAAGVAAYDDSMKKLSAVFDTFKIQLTVAIAPALTTLTELISEQVIKWGGLGSIAKVVAQAMISGMIGVLQGIKLAVEGVESLIKVYEKLKLTLLETRQTFNNLGVAAGVSDLDFDRTLEIARLKKSINSPIDSPVLNSAISGLNATKQQISNTNQNGGNKEKLDITVRTTEGFALSLAGSPEFAKVIQAGTIAAAAREAAAVRS